VFRHPVLTLKKVARLPSKDRADVMKVMMDSKVMRVLMKKIHNRRRRRERVTKSLEEVHEISSNDSSNATSGNNDWLNWVTLKGGEEGKEGNIQDIGKSLGVSFKGTMHNNFAVLARSRKVEGGPVLTMVEHGEDEEIGDA
jgi:hypothetical protein